MREEIEALVAQMRKAREASTSAFLDEAVAAYWQGVMSVVGQLELILKAEKTS